MTQLRKWWYYSILFLISSGLLPAQAPTPQLWYWHHSLLNNPQAVESSKKLIDRAYEDGYTGVAFWDVSFEYLGTPLWAAYYAQYVQEAMSYAVSKGMKVMAPVAPFGYSNDLLEYHPEWAEAQRVVGTEFQVNSNATRLELINSFPGLLNPGFESGRVDWFDIGDPGVGLDTSVAHTGRASAVIHNAPADGRIRQLMHVKPWRQYHLRFFYKSRAYRGYAQFGIFDPSNFSMVRVTDEIRAGVSQDWTEADYAFNSQDSTELWLYLGVYGGNSGWLWLDDIEVEETALVYVTRGRAGTPLEVYDPNNPSMVYTEGRDYNAISDPRMGVRPFLYTDSYHTPPAVTLPAGTRLRPGQTVAIKFYAAFPVPGQGDVNMCVSSTLVADYLNRNAQAIAAVMPQGGGLLLGYDEIRQFNSCAVCRAKHMNAAQLLDWHVGQSIERYQSVMPQSPLYVWSDMFDPYHNAHNNYYYVEGDLTGSWSGLPANVILMNWNLGNLHHSLGWFSGNNADQPVAHQQIIAGYYDSGNGAAAARAELATANGIPGVLGLMYTSWNSDYSQLKHFADAAKAAWPAYLNSLPGAGVDQPVGGAPESRAPPR